MSSVFSRQKLQESRQRRAERSNHSVLLVDDEPSNVRVLSTMLSDRYTVITADDGTSALEAIEQLETGQQISLVISDQRMPRMTGLQLFERLDTVLPGAKRIIVTGYMDVDVILAAINRAHIHQFVLKPIDRDEMLLTVQRALESFEMERQLQAHVEQLEHKVAERTRELERRNEELLSAYAQVEEASLTDTLTGLRNRRYLQHHFESEVSLIQREHHDGVNSDQDLIFLLADIDYFKAVNDRYGHAAGDRMLELFSDRLRSVYRGSDLIIRWGGEEFLIVARFARHDGGGAVAERLRAAIADAPFDLGDGVSLDKTCSIGFAAYPFFADAPEAADWRDVVALADRALYTAKRSGRNQWVGIGPHPECDDRTVKPLLADPARCLREGRARVSSRADDPASLNWD